MQDRRDVTNLGCSGEMPLLSKEDIFHLVRDPEHGSTTSLCAISGYSGEWDEENSPVSPKVHILTVESEAPVATQFPKTHIEDIAPSWA